jgi:hypothetical protein
MIWSPSAPSYYDYFIVARPYPEYRRALDNATNREWHLVKTAPDILDRSHVASDQVEGTAQGYDILGDSLRCSVEIAATGHNCYVFSALGSQVNSQTAADSFQSSHNKI